MLIHPPDAHSRPASLPWTTPNALPIGHLLPHLARALWSAPDLWRFGFPLCRSSNAAQHSPAYISPPCLFFRGYIAVLVSPNHTHCPMLTHPPDTLIPAMLAWTTPNAVPIGHLLPTWRQPYGLRQTSDALDPHCAAHQTRLNILPRTSPTVPVPLWFILPLASFISVSAPSAVTNSVPDGNPRKPPAKARKARASPSATTARKGRESFGKEKVFSALPALLPANRNCTSHCAPTSVLCGVFGGSLFMRLLTQVKVI